MPRYTSNSLPKNTLQDEPAKAPPEPKEKKKTPTPKSKQVENLNPKNSRLEKISQVVGIFSLLTSFFLFVAIISFLINWFSGDSDDIFSGVGFARVFSDKTLEANNLGGRLGAAASILLVKQGFGIGTLFVPIWLFVLGVRLTLKHKIIALGSSFGFILLAMAWLSITLGFLFRNSALSILGGISGYESSLYLEGLMGKLGLMLLLIFIFVAFLVIVYNFSLHQVKHWLEKRKRQGFGSSGEDLNNQDLEYAVNARNAQDIPVDKYNTVEFAVKDFEKDNTSGTQSAAQPSNGKEQASNTQFEPVAFPKTKPQANAEVEFTVETPETSVANSDFTTVTSMPEFVTPGSQIPDFMGADAVEHHTMDTAYDPHLDLATYVLPGIDLLDEYGAGTISVTKDELEANKNRIVSTLGNYGIQIDKIKATIGPTVTLYEIIPAPGVRISKIKNLEDDIALSLSALGIRIIAPIPGKGTIGIEVPNQHPAIVGMKSLIASEKFKNNQYDLPFAIGKTISNEEFIADLTKMPHILMAGATGQGKSVGLNAIITSLLYKKHPSELKFVMVDPKKVELTLFSKIERHYLAKLPDSEEAIITDTRKVVRTLNSLNIEMDNRYDLLKEAQVRNIKEYNTKFIARKLNPLNGHRFMPYIVVVIDEFADLILTAGKEVEHPITRLAQLARAIGIHLVIATQRPSVNIITGTIKANFPARIAFRVISKIDSRTILDTGGADQLIGRGDLLMSQGGDMIRLQCAFIDLHEVERVTEFIGSQRGYPTAYALPEFNEEESEMQQELDPGERDELFEDAAYLIVSTQQGSTSLLQRKLKLGYNRAGRIIDQLEAAGIVGPFEGSKAREVKVATEFALEQFLKDLNSKKTPEEF
ncbi:MAG: DNA translocase FtsK [Lentimicrobiaceae bacterium]|jgi:S-DNA-T family DNA segregation ATPase FtsK/SpoIIIE